ncbi:MAG: DNA mismatch repair protein MutL, partial [Chitinophagaceae bacterium]
VFFSLTSNGQQLFYLEGGSLKQRIVQLLGTNYSAKLVSVKENTDYLNVYGFIGKPETAKKTRGDQYFFVNNRFIKSGYLHHAIMHAYQDLIPLDSFPAYVLFIDLDPTQIDVNVHPTKQEIKFEDEKIVYAFMQAAVKHALAQFSITPTLDFNLDASIQGLDAVQKPFTEREQLATQTSTIFRAFTEANQAHKVVSGEWSASKETPSGFVSLTKQLMQMQEVSIPETVQLTTHHAPLTGTPTQVFNTYILLPAADKFYLIHQQAAHERIIYERLEAATLGRPVATQQSLFPVSIELTPQDAVLLTELLPDLQKMGYTIEPFGRSTFVIQGTPADVVTGNEKGALENILEHYKHFSSELKLPRRELLLRTVAWQQSVKTGNALTEKEMTQLVEDLFNCRQPNATASGRPTYLEFGREQLEKMFIR